MTSPKKNTGQKMRYEYPNQAFCFVNWLENIRESLSKTENDDLIEDGGNHSRV